MSITKYGDYAHFDRSTFFDIFIEYVQSDRILCWIYRKDEIYEKSGSAGGGSDGGERYDLCVCIQGYGIEYPKFESARIS